MSGYGGHTVMSNGEREHYPPMANQSFPHMNSSPSSSAAQGSRGNPAMLTPPMSPIVVNPLVRNPALNQGHPHHRLGLNSSSTLVATNQTLLSAEAHGSYPYLSHMGQANDSYQLPPRQYFGGYQGSSCYPPPPPPAMFHSYNNVPYSKAETEVTSYSYPAETQYRDDGYYNSCAMTPGGHQVDGGGVIQSSNSHNRSTFNMAPPTYDFNGVYQNGGNEIRFVS